MILLQELGETTISACDIQHTGASASDRRLESLDDVLPAGPFVLTSAVEFGGPLFVETAIEIIELSFRDGVRIRGRSMKRSPMAGSGILAQQWRKGL